MSQLFLRGVLPALLLVSPAWAHGGHENVPEGEAISLEPIVRVPPVSADSLGWAQLTDSTLGFDVMDSYDFDGICLWHPVPAGHGSRGKFLS